MARGGVCRCGPLIPTGGFFDGVSVFDPNQITSKANRSKPGPGLSHTLPAVANSPICFKTDQDPESHGNICPTLQVPSRSGGGQQHAVAIAPTVSHTLNADGMGRTVRRLTPRECERLQGFPDDYTLVPHRGKPAADGPRYKALGNSWAVPCARWIGARIAKLF